MNRLRIVITAVLFLFAGASQLAQGKPRKVAAKATPHKVAAHVRVSRKKANGRASARGKWGSNGRWVAKTAPAQSWRSRQLAPSSDRYREIQEALVSKGYLKSTPTGTWDADSQDAMKRFQADQKLDDSGKINSLSLIALGLGPAKTPEPAAPPPKP